MGLSTLIKLEKLRMKIGPPIMIVNIIFFIEDNFLRSSISPIIAAQTIVKRITKISLIILGNITSIIIKEIHNPITILIPPDSATSGLSIL
ncbi:hypothetical protein ES703_95363 [subsurface metagenome]